MSDDFQAPREGFSTLAAQFTKADVERIVGLVKNLRDRGWNEQKILARMREDLRSYSPRTVSLLYALSTGRPVPDDLEPADVASEKSPKPDTLEVQLRQADKQVQPGDLIRFRGKTWFVGSVRGGTCVLKDVS